MHGSKPMMFEYTKLKTSEPKLTRKMKMRLLFAKKRKTRLLSFAKRPIKRRTDAASKATVPTEESPFINAMKPSIFLLRYGGARLARRDRGCFDAHADITLHAFR